MSDATTKFQVGQYLSNGGFFENFMPHAQRFALREALNGEEGDFFVDMLMSLKKRIETMPQTYETEGVECKDKTIYLHYFSGPVDAWIAEKDVGDGTDDKRQFQAFGMQSFGGLQDAEWGYVSIQELIDNGIELDLHWEPKQAKDLK